jgi:hypothetical protein
MSAFMRNGIIVICAIVGLGIGCNAARAQDASDSAKTTEAKKPVPPYHASPPKGQLPATLDPTQFTDAETRNIYALAAKVKAILYQEPCYCGCDKEAGHKSLLDCFTDLHGSGCDLCKKEAVFTATETQKGKTPAQIRREIIAGQWKTVDLSMYGGTNGAQ